MASTGNKTPSKNSEEVRDPFRLEHLTTLEVIFWFLGTPRTPIITTSLMHKPNPSFQRQ
ncbi:unnamed protein product [Hymenolepis diminuta]|uniref:Uncharacterized protein n=1 Tax=Hymenolepis diminuta TaxID=6216 RepID=A0A564YS30_HYMDI|nr:unnamed protein product [Hymenolepis diminuta]